MRISAFCTAVLTYVVIGHPPPAVAQVDQQRAQEDFKEAQVQSRYMSHVELGRNCADWVVSPKAAPAFVAHLTCGTSRRSKGRGAMGKHAATTTRTIAPARGSEGSRDQRISVVGY